MKIETKPCPFCGATDIEPQTFDVQDREGWPTSIRCNECGAAGPWTYVPERDGFSQELVKLWNERADG